jgi:hypothetical protein
VNDLSHADKAIVDRLNRELAAIAVPARPSRSAPRQASGALPTLLVIAAVLVAVAIGVFRYLPATSDNAASQGSAPLATTSPCPVTSTRDASGVIVGGGNLGLIEVRPTTFPGEKVIVLVRRGAKQTDTLSLRADPVPQTGGAVVWPTHATERTTAWGGVVFEVNTKPIGNAGCWRLVTNDGVATDPGIVVDLGR